MCVSVDKQIMMKKILLLSVVLTSMAVSAQTKHMVTVRDDIFTPKNLTINQGDTVVWTNVQGFHNVNGLQSTYTANTSDFGNSVAGPGWTYQFVFTNTGANNYQCDPHVGLGMVGTIQVNPVSSILDKTSKDYLINGLQLAGENITISNKAKPNLTVYSLTGILVANYKASNTLQIPSERGVYFIVVEDSGVPTVFKIQVQ